MLLWGWTLWILKLHNIYSSTTIQRKCLLSTRNISKYLGHEMCADIHPPLGLHPCETLNSRCINLVFVASLLISLEPPPSTTFFLILCTQANILCTSNTNLYAQIKKYHLSSLGAPLVRLFEDYRSPFCSSIQHFYITRCNKVYIL